MKNIKKLLALLIALAMTSAMLGVTAFAAEAANTPVTVATDDFESYVIDATDKANLPVGEKKYLTHKLDDAGATVDATSWFGCGYFGASHDAKAGVVQDPSTTEPNKVLALETRTSYDAWKSKPMAIYQNFKANATDKYTYKVDMYKEYENGGMGIAFNWDGAKDARPDKCNWYAIDFQGKGNHAYGYSNLTADTVLFGTGIYKGTKGSYKQATDAVISTVDGAFSNTYNGVKYPGDHFIPAKKWYTMAVTVYRGEISWTLTDRETGAVKQTGSWKDASPIMSQPTSFALVAGGQYEYFAYFDNVSVEKTVMPFVEEGVELPENTIIYDNFNTYNEVYDYPDYTNDKNAAIAGKWVTRSAGSWSTNTTAAGGSKAAIVLNPSGIGKSLTLSTYGYADNLSYGPIAEYNGISMDTVNNKYNYKFDIYRIDSQAGGGINFNVSPDGTKYYRLQFKGTNIGQVSGTNATSRTVLYRNDGTTGVGKFQEEPITISSPGLTTGYANMLHEDTWYTVDLTVDGGNINWTVAKKSDGTIVQTGSYVDENPLLSASSKMRLFGAGQGDRFVMFDNVIVTETDKTVIPDNAIIYDNFNYYDEADSVNEYVTKKGETVAGNWIATANTTWSEDQSKAAIILNPNGAGKVATLSSYGFANFLNYSPSLEYTGVTMNTKENAYTYKFDISRPLANGWSSQHGGGIEFSKSADGKQYYRLQFFGENLGDDFGAQYTNRVQLFRVDNCETKLAPLDIEVSSTGLGANNMLKTDKWYTIELTVDGGNISWTAVDKATGETVITGSYKDEAPIENEAAKMRLFAGGQQGNYMMFDNVLVTESERSVAAVAKIGDAEFETLEAAFAAANDGDTITLVADTEIAEAIINTKAVTLDLAGKTVVYNNTVQGESMITNKGDLTINDSVGTGVINYNYTGAADSSYGIGNYTISNAGTLTVNGGKITIANLRAHAKYPINNNSTTGDAILVINGGHLYNYNTSAIRQFCNSTTYKNSVTINGGLIEGYSAIWMQNPGAKTVNGSLAITGGEIRTTAAAYVNGTAELKDVASKIYCTTEGGAWTEDSAVSITGGTINENVYLAAEAPAAITVGEEAIYNGYVELPVPEIDPVAKIGDAEFETLEAAVAAAVDGDTITLVADVEGDVTVAEGKTITIDLAGFDIVGEMFAITNNGTLTIKDSVGTGNVYTVNVDAQGRSTIVNNGTLTIESGWFGDSDNDTTNRNAVNRGPAVRNYGTATINGGYFTDISNQLIDGAYAYAFITATGATTTINDAVVYGDINGLVYSDGKTIVNGGSFTLGFEGQENNLWYLAYGDVEIKGGTWNRAFAVPSWNTGNPTVYGAVKVSAGTFNVELPAVNIAEDAALIKNLDGKYVAGSKPTATVNNMGSMVVAGGSYTCYPTSASNEADMPLNFVMQFIADETAEDMATSPYADWYADFVITVTGLENGSFTADNCYLAGYYGDFGWVKIPIDGLKVEEGVRYPVMLLNGLGQKYDYICEGVKDFRCAMYLDEAILEANPNLNINLELSLVDNAKGQDAARDAIIAGTDCYKVEDIDYVAEEFKTLVLTAEKAVVKGATGVVMFASYDENGKLIEANYAAASENVPVNVNLDGAKTLKAMLWESLASIAPICNAEAITLN